MPINSALHMAILITYNTNPYMTGLRGLLRDNQGRMSQTIYLESRLNNIIVQDLFLLLEVLLRNLRFLERPSSSNPKRQHTQEPLDYETSSFSENRLRTRTSRAHARLPIKNYKPGPALLIFTPIKRFATSLQ